MYIKYKLPGTINNMQYKCRTIAIRTSIEKVPGTAQTVATYHKTQINKKFWEELIRQVSLHKIAVSNLVSMVTMEHNPNPPLTKAHLTKFKLNNLK
jgi:hypothetical protein